jgi:trafficking protein particle complex subunit 2
MSYYFSIIGTRDKPLFEIEFGTSKGGGDGTARFQDEAKYMNQFIVHAALDMVEDVQWANKDLYFTPVSFFVQCVCS